MSNGMGSKFSALGIALGLGAATLLSGCATKKFVRTEVNTGTHQLDEKLTARLDTHDKMIKSTSGQVDELNAIARDHNQKISSLNDGLQQTDGKAQAAMKTGQGALDTANRAVSNVDALDSRFQNRNHYLTLTEEQIPFQFNSAKIDKAVTTKLDGIAQQIKENADAILVLEGHTDAVGPDQYNIALGQKRLEAVVRYLVVSQEVPMNRISNLSFGEERPIADNKTKEGRAQNRSVVVRIMGPQASAENSVSQAMPATAGVR